MRLKGSRIAAYARFSSDKQSETSTEDQLRRIRDWAAREGVAVTDGLVFDDRAVSGASTARPGFERLMSRVRRGEIDVLLVEDISRLSRDNADALALYRELAFHGVQLVSLADGIDSTSKGAKLHFGVKALFADLYLSDLADKTRRGMDGRALAGLSTGGLPLGYRAVAVDPRSETAGRRIEIDADGAALIRRIFELFVGGGSFGSIARQLNREGVPSPRDRTRHREKPGWGHTTIRDILMNEKYAGVWTFGERRWVKVPGTNRRVPRAGDAADVVRCDWPHLRIVGEETWTAAQARLAERRAVFTVGPDGKRRGKGAPGGDQAHPLSGLLRCACGAPMTIYGGGRYYVCAATRRGRCDLPRAPLRADVARRRILETLRDLLASPAGVARVRARWAQRAAEEVRNRGGELAELRARLARTDRRIANVVAAIADEGKSQALSLALRDLEASATRDRAELSTLERAGQQPIPLISPDEVIARVLDLERRLEADPGRARDELRRLFRDQRIVLELGDDRVYTARSEVLPLVLLTAKRNSPSGEPEGLYVERCSGGAIPRSTYESIAVAYAARLCL
jgi:site-specific DNA recombinase